MTYNGSRSAYSCFCLFMALLLRALQGVESQGSDGLIHAVGSVAIMLGIRELREVTQERFGKLGGMNATDTSPVSSDDGDWHSSGLDYIELRCPDVRDPEDGFWKPDPNCNLPTTRRIVQGSKSVAAFQRAHGVTTGDLVTATFRLRPAVIRPLRNTSDELDPIMAEASEEVDPIPELLPGSIQVISKSSAPKEIYSNQPIYLHGVVYLLDFCGWKNPIRSADDYKRYLFNGLTSVQGNIQDYYGTCSFNKVFWMPSNVTVVGPLEVECKGMTDNPRPLAFDGSSACGTPELTYWAASAENQAQDLAAQDSLLSSILQSTYRRRAILVLPKEVKCKWAGLADYACMNPICRSFIKGTHATSVHVMFHELQHNTGLHHAGRGSVEYGDSTDPMGTYPAESAGPQCHNAPYNWRIGWAVPIPGGVLTASNFTPTVNRLSFTIPASGTTDKNMVIVNLAFAFPRADSPFIQYPKYFLSYRVKNTTYGGYDGGLYDMHDKKVLVHVYNGSMDERDTNRSLYIDAGPGFMEAPDPALPAGNVWRAPFVPFNPATNLGGGFQVRVVSVGPTSARVEVCRMSSLFEGIPGSKECQVANQDRDCDGLSASDDPDCMPKVVGADRVTPHTPLKFTSSPQTARTRIGRKVQPPPPPPPPPPTRRPLPMRIRLLLPSKGKRLTPLKGKKHPPPPRFTISSSRAPLPRVRIPPPAKHPKPRPTPAPSPRRFPPRPSLQLAG